MTNFRSTSLNVIASPRSGRGDPAGLLRRIAPRNEPLRMIIRLILLAIAPLSALAQSVRWDPPGGSLGFNQVGQLALVFEDCEPDGEPKLPSVDGLQVAGPRYTIGDAPVGNSGLSVDDISSATLETPQKSVWAGEVFPLTYHLDVVRRYFHSLASNVEWAAAPAVADDWTKPDPAETLIRGERRVISEQTTRASIKQPGIYTLKPASQLVNLMVGSTAFGLFSQPNVEQRQIDSKPLELTVKPLPSAPPEFSGAVGEFSFASKVVPTSAGVGEPITWTLELTGVGNWPDIGGLPQREVSNDFQVVQPKSKRTMKDGTLFEGALSEDVVLVPTRPGTYRLAPVRFSYFDPKTGSYKSITSDAVTVTVSGTSAPVQPPANSGAPVQFS